MDKILDLCKPALNLALDGDTAIRSREVYSL